MAPGYWMRTFRGMGQVCHGQAQMSINMLALG
jgi:hypothetical protein